MTDLIKRAERYLDISRVTGNENEFAQVIIRDLIAALQAAPTADDLRKWADCTLSGVAANAMREAADRMEPPQ